MYANSRPTAIQRPTSICIPHIYVYVFAHVCTCVFFIYACTLVFDMRPLGPNLDQDRRKPDFSILGFDYLSQEAI